MSTRLIASFACCAFALASAAPSDAATRTWTGTIDSYWDTPGNWDTGVPQTGDAAILNAGPNIELKDSTASLDTFNISNGLTLSTRGYRLKANNSNEGLLVIDGTGTTVFTQPAIGVFSLAIDTDDMLIANGARLDMADGIVQVDDQLTIGANGSITGFGTLDMRNDAARPEPILANSGTIEAIGGSLQIDTVNGGQLDLDGTGAEDGQGTLAVTQNTDTLTIDATLSDTFNGHMSVGMGNTIAFTQPLALSNATLSFVVGPEDTPQPGTPYTVITAPLVLGSFGSILADPYNGHIPYVTRVMTDRIEIITATEGDANADGQTDSIDLTTLASHWNTSGNTWSQGDFNNDGWVDSIDLYLLSRNWSADPQEPSSLSWIDALDVPEPASFGAFLIGLGTLAGRRCTRR